MVTPEVIEFPAVSPSAHDGTWESRVPYREGYWPVLRQLETELIRAALREAGGNWLG